jgi:hypothetical protein
MSEANTTASKASTKFNLDGSVREKMTRFKNLKKVKTLFPEYSNIILVDDSEEHAELNEKGSVLLIKEFTGDYDEEFLRIKDLLMCTEVL